MSFAIDYKDRLSEFEFDSVRNMGCKSISILMQGKPHQGVVGRAVENREITCRTEEPGPTMCSRTIKFLDMALGSVLVLLVILRLLAPYPIVAEKLAYTPNKLFLRIIRPDIDWNATLEEAVLNNPGNIEAGLGSYRIYIGK